MELLKISVGVEEINKYEQADEFISIIMRKWLVIKQNTIIETKPVLLKFQVCCSFMMRKFLKMFMLDEHYKNLISIHCTASLFIIVAINIVMTKLVLY